MPNGYLTWAEIEAKYPDEWVLIDRPRTTDRHEVLGGWVVWHHAERMQFDRQLDQTVETLGDLFAVLHTGRPVPGEAYLLASGRP